MAIPIDTSKAFRFSDELTALARAVHAAQDDDELRWIEWKGTLDLAADETVKTLAKNILGFANRDPHIAARRGGGYGYIFIGVEPEKLPGVKRLDFEKLSPKIKKFTGAAIVWHPEYLDLDGQSVLVIAVEPPRPGDPIHTLKKPFETFESGAVFVRHHAATERAHDSDMTMLQHRLLARADQLDLAVEAVAPQIERLPDLVGLTRAWLAQERDRLTARQAPQRPQHSLADLMGLSADMTGLLSRDRRTREDYEAEVQEYLTEAKGVLAARLLTVLEKHRPAALRLKAANLTDLSYSKMKIVVRLPVGVRSLPEERGSSDWPELPEPPREWGRPQHPYAALYTGSGIAPLGLLRVAGLSRLVRRGGPRLVVEDQGDGVRIEFSNLELHAHSTEPLEDVPLLIHADVGSRLEVQWEATAINGSGKPTDAIVVTVTESTITSDVLFDEPDTR